MGVALSRCSFVAIEYTFADINLGTVLFMQDGFSRFRKQLKTSQPNLHLLNASKVWYANGHKLGCLLHIENSWDAQGHLQRRPQVHQVLGKKFH
jgi:hypothetical protein